MSLKIKPKQKEQNKTNPSKGLLNPKTTVCVLAPWNTYLSIKGAGKQNGAAFPELSKRHI